ncbi:MAG: hypothetical protein AB1646_18040 [Thermodesulfobacteriota bacterium]
MARIMVATWVCLIALGAGVALPGAGYAQTTPLAIASGLFVSFWVIVAFATATPLLEAEVIWRVVRKPTGVWWKLLEWSFLINLVTLIPALGLLVSALNLIDPADFTLNPPEPLLIAAVLLCGLLNIGLEFPLLLWLFRRLYHKGILQEPIPTSRTAMATAAALLVRVPVLLLGIMILLAHAPGPPPFMFARVPGQEVAVTEASEHPAAGVTGQHVPGSGPRARQMIPPFGNLTR